MDAKASRPVWAIGAVVVAFVLWYSVALSDGGNDSGSGGFARLACEQKVKAQLASPSSARFSGVSATEGTAGRWTVTGNVDAENSFGASLRSSFTCDLRHTSGENYSGTARVN